MPKVNSSGSVVITVILTLMVVIGLGLVYYFYTRLNSLGTIDLPSTTVRTQADPTTSNWLFYQDPKSGVSLKIPPDWYVSDDNTYISQFPYNPNRFSSSDIYNDFFIEWTESQLQSGYTNSDWLNKIDNLKPDEKLTNEFRPATTLQIVKLSSGKTAEGIRFVMFKNTGIEEGAIAAFEKNNKVYQMIMRHYNQEGLDTLQKIMTTATVGTPQATP